MNKNNGCYNIFLYIFLKVTELFIEGILIMKKDKFKDKYFDLFQYLLGKAQIENRYEELLVRSISREYLSFILNIRKEDINEKKYENPEFAYADEHTTAEIFRILGPKYPPFKIEIMFIVHLIRNKDKNDFCVPDPLSAEEKQTLKNLVFSYGINLKQLKLVDGAKLAKRYKKNKKFNLFDAIKVYFDEFESINNEEMVYYEDYSKLREEPLSDKEVLNAFLHFIDPFLTESRLNQFKMEFKEYIVQIRELDSKGFFANNSAADKEEFYYNKAIDVLNEFVEVLNADTIMSERKRLIRNEIDFFKNFIKIYEEYEKKIKLEHLPLVDQVLLTAPAYALMNNYIDFIDGFAETEEDVYLIKKTGTVPKYYQYAFIQAFYNKLSQYEFSEKTEHKLIRILNILSNLTKLLGEEFKEISSYDDDNIAKILRK